MTLDLLQLAPQVQAMAQEAGARRRTLAWRRDVAVSVMEAWDARLDELRLLVQQEQPWLVAEPLEPLRAAVPAPAMPPDKARATAWSILPDAAATSARRAHRERDSLPRRQCSHRSACHRPHLGCVWSLGARPPSA